MRAVQPYRTLFPKGDHPGRLRVLYSWAWLQRITEAQRLDAILWIDAEPPRRANLGGTPGL